MSTLRSFWRSPQGASAAEFALVLPLALLFLFGILDVGWYAWTFNQNEKATQMGARLAVVTDPVANGLANFNFIGVSGLTQGDVIPASALGTITCTSSSCACTGCPDGMSVSLNSAAFGRVVARMQLMNARIQPANVVVEYRGSGLGYAGDPGGMDIAPLTTVRLQNMQFAPFTTLLFSWSVVLPSASYSLTMEDASGSVSN